MSAISLPVSDRDSVPAYLADFRSPASRRRKRISSGVKSISFRKERLRRFSDISGSSRTWWSGSGVALERTRHAVAAAAALAELEAFDRDDLDALLAQGGVAAGVALVGHDDAGLEGHHVVAVIPLLALGLEGVAAGLDHAHLVDVERRAHGVDEGAVELLDHKVLGGIAGPDRPGPRAPHHVREEGHQV